MWIHTGCRRDCVFLKDFHVFIPHYNPINPAKIPPCATPSSYRMHEIYGGTQRDFLKMHYISVPFQISVILVIWIYQYQLILDNYCTYSFLYFILQSSNSYLKLIFKNINNLIMLLNLIFSISQWISIFHIVYCTLHALN